MSDAVRLSVDNFRPCPSGDQEVWSQSTTPTLRARVSDADPDSLNAEFEWWKRGGDRVGGGHQSGLPNGARSEITIPSGSFVDGDVLSWRGRVSDRTDTGPRSEWCHVRIDATRPQAPPAVSSSEYPRDERGGGVGRTGVFTFNANGDRDVTGFAYDLVDAPTPSTGHWPLDDHGATAADTSGNGNDGELRGGATWQQGRIGGGAARLNGHGSRIVTRRASVPTDRNFAVSAWVRLDGRALNGIAVSQDGGFTLGYSSDVDKWVFTVPRSGTQMDVAVADAPAQHGVWTHLAGEYDSGGTGSLRLYVNGRLAISQGSTFTLGYRQDIDRWAAELTDRDGHTTLVAPTVGVRAGEWTHLTVQYDAWHHELRIYVNGQLWSSALHNGLVHPTGAVQIGRSADRPAGYWPGGIDDTRVYTGILSDLEIVNLYHR